MTSIQVFDGNDTIGGNKIYIEENGHGLFLDFGMNFNKYGNFFQEYISPRSKRGLHDLINLDLIPKLDIYRKDLIPKDLDISSYPSLNIEAVLLSHAHMDHWGNIGLLRPDYPIIASPSTIMLLKTISDSSSSKLGSNVVYYSLKTPKEDGRILDSDRNKVIGRDFVCTDNFSESFHDFFTSNTKNRKKFEKGNLSSLKNFSSNFEINAYEVDHSIYGATAYILTGDNTIVYTGDFRLHGKKRKKSEEFIKKARDASVLIIEGTRVAGDDINESEEIVYNNCLEKAEKANGLIVADFTARNFERLEMFSLIAKKLGRILIITAKDAYLLYGLRKVDNIDRIKDLRVYNDMKISSKNWEKILLNIEPKINFIDPSEIFKDQERYIICFSLYDIKNLLDIKPNNGLYIYSSSEAFEEESEFDFIRLSNWVKYFNFEIVGFNINMDKRKLRPQFTKGYHASGHVSKSDLIRVIDKIDPDIIIPVHTDYPQWFSKNFENAVLLKNNKLFKI
ncbi:MAG: MBL fold metallo-hydrolase RNA specificity domain-containing protein [Promethearchaeota archaeon]